MSKLYTEYQMKWALVKMMYAAKRKELWLKSNKEQLDSEIDCIINHLNPIELPTDEEIDNASLLISSERMEFIKGAKWMRDKIKEEQ